MTTAFLKYFTIILITAASFAYSTRRHRRSPCPTGCTCFRTTVKCSHRNLTSVPNNMPITTEVLDLKWNYLARIQAKDFVGLPDLQVLLLSSNEIESVDDFSFANLHKLRILHLDRNLLKTVQMNAVAGLTRLEVLNLHTNLVSKIDNQAFKDLLGLKQLHLHNNHLSMVPHKSMLSLHRLQKLTIDKQALICGCKLEHRKPAYTCPITGMENSADCHMIKSNDEDDDNERVGITVSETVDLICKYKNVDHDLNTTADFYECSNKILPKPPRSPPGSDSLTPDYHSMDKKRKKLRRSTRSVIDVETDVGDTVQLSCKVTGGQSSAHQMDWYFENTPVPREGRFSRLQNGNLLIQSVKIKDAGRYMCISSSTSDTTRARDHRQHHDHHHTNKGSIRLTVRQPPEFTIVPHDLFAFEGSQIHINCEATGYPVPMISWTKENKPLRQSRRVVLETNQTKITIYPLLREDAGVYHCHATNILGTKKASGSVHIKSSIPPKITVAPSEQNVPRSGTAAFQCKSTGEPTPRIVWHFNGSPVPTIRGHFEISNQNTLYVHEVTENDEGYYTCQAVNDVGAMSAEAKLTIYRSEQGGFVSTAFGEINRDLIVSSVRKATADVDRAINATRRNLYGPAPKTPSELLAIFRFPGPQAIELARAREIYERTLLLIQQHVRAGLRFDLDEFAYDHILSPAHLQMISELSGCNVHREEPDCSDMCFHTKYRTYDGTCNNLQVPMTGSSHTPFKRLLPPIYENGFDQPVGWTRKPIYFGFMKPNARKVVNTIVSAKSITPDPEHSHMLMQWGQFLDHDLDFAILSPSIEQFDGGIRCKVTCQNRAPCFNIEVPSDDPRIRTISCIEMERSSAICGSGETSLFFNKVQPREQINQITSFIDASNVYASTERDALDLRDLFSDHGLLKFDITSHKQKPFLPFNRDAAMDCRRNRTVEHNVRCFLAGDHRANEQLGLLAMHTLWLREHNRIASALFKHNPHWDGEKLYQEARKVVGAQMQVITYKHWLPKILGPAGMEMLGEYRGYQPDVDPAIANAFATAAFRFGHTLIQPLFMRLNASFKEIPDRHIMLHDAFFSPEKILNEGGIDPLLRGLFASPAKLLMPDQFMNQELTEKLFTKAHEVALDLASLNIQRGRDHAVPGYLAYRKWCNLTAPDNFDGLATDIPDPTLRQKLRTLYGHPGNIDLFVGALSEKKLPGAKIGPTFVCIIADQFKRLRDGDRFWYENPGIFTPLQLIEMKKATLAKVLCNNGDEIDRVQHDVFRYPGSQNPQDYAPCREIPDINLNMWQECCSDSCLGKTSPSYSSEESALAEASRIKRRSITERQHQFPAMNHDQRMHHMEQRMEHMQEVIHGLERMVEKMRRDKSEL